MASHDDPWCIDDHTGGVLAISRIDHAPEVAFVLKGELDLASVVTLTSCVSDALDTYDTSALVFDLSNLAFIDSSGLQLLIDTQSRTRAAGVQFRLRAPSRPVVRVLQISGLDDFFPVEEPPGRQPARAGEDPPKGQRWGSRS